MTPNPTSVLSLIPVSVPLNVVGPRLAVKISPRDPSLPWELFAVADHITTTENKQLQTITNGINILIRLLLRLYLAYLISHPRGKEGTPRAEAQT